jgi:hypothetical protein
MQPLPPVYPVVNNNHEDLKMNASILTYATPSAPLNVPSSTVKPAPYYQARQLRKQEAVQAFEAGVKWFLEVSRKA